MIEMKRLEKQTFKIPMQSTVICISFSGVASMVMTVVPSIFVELQRVEFLPVIFDA